MNQVITNDGRSHSIKELCSIYEKKLAEKGEDFFNPKYKNEVVGRLDELGEQVYYNYKQITEAYNICRMCLALKQQDNRNFRIILGDSPDIIILEDYKNKIAFEIYEAYEFKSDGRKEKINTINEVKKVWQKKGNIAYLNKPNLLIVNRKISDREGFDFSQYLEEINKYNRRFFREIRIHIVSGKIHSFYRVFPSKDNEIRIIEFKIL